LICLRFLNNVETFANVPLNYQNGADWYKSIGTEKSPGTKAFALTGNIEIPVLLRFPMGTTLREVIFDIGGGMRNGADLKPCKSEARREGACRKRFGSSTGF